MLLKYMKSSDSFRCWLLAFSLSWTNLTNGWAWIAYASISDFTAQYYNVSLSQVNWISLLYAIIMTFCSFPFIWIIERYGVKLSLVLSAILNLLCATIHVISSSEFVALDWRYPILIVGSISGGLAQPLCLFSSTKLAGIWFSPANRVSANTLATMGNPLGILISNLLSPSIVTDKSKLPYLNLVNLSPPIIGLILVLLSIYCVPKPLSMQPEQSFYSQVKICFCNVQFWILVICFGTLLSMFTTISTLIQQILCPLGYSDLFSGICGALFLVMGIPGVLIVGTIVTRTGALKEVVKWGVLLTSFGMISFSVTSTLSGHDFLLALSISLMGILGFGVFPSALELAAETTHPAGEVISTGVLISISQALSLVFVMFAQATAVSHVNLSKLSVCSVTDIRSYWIPVTVLASLSVINAVVFIFTFNTDYKRVISETDKPNLNQIYVPVQQEDE